MEKEQNTIGLSRDYIIHPGETLSEVLTDRDMTQKELSIRTGMTEKHISTVIHGQKSISAAFAKKLEYALGIEASFWMNLQSNYDCELLEFEELNGISEQEIAVLKNLKEVLEYWSNLGWLNTETTPAWQVLDLRKIFGMSNLLDIPKMSYAGAYRAQVKNTTDPYVLYAWQRMCEILTQRISVAEELDIKILQEKIPDIKQTMFLRANQIQKRLTTIFAECGISFRIVPNFKGAPVQGFIKRTEAGAIILCVTLRQKFADIFWFTLFHEIAHILNGDTKNLFVDFDSVSGDMETKADNLASVLLLNQKEYRRFVQSGKYATSNGIDQFAKSQNVRDFIVQGRLMKEEVIPWKARMRYDWA